MKDNEGKILGDTEHDIPKTMWTIDYSKCTVCGECVVACQFGLLRVKDKRIIIISQTGCIWCGNCADACASDAIELT